MAERFFNTSGPVVAEDHYCVPPLERFDLEEILRLIRAKRYFVLHAPRQTGKTSGLLALRDLLNAGDEYRCVYANIETAQTARGDVARGMKAVLHELRIRTRTAFADGVLEELVRGALEEAGADGALREVLVRWSTADARPLVLLLDEIDALVGDTLISVLRQLRAGYDQRPSAFPQSVILCGIRGGPAGAAPPRMSAGSGTCATTASTRSRLGRSSPAAAPSTSRRNRCGWATSARPT